MNSREIGEMKIMMTYQTLTVAHAGFIFDYTVDVGSDVQVYHENGDGKVFIESLGVEKEFMSIEDLESFALKWYQSRVDVDKVKCIFMEDGKLTITVGKDLKFQQRVLEVEGYREAMIEVYHVDPSGEVTWLDEINLEEVVTYESYGIMSDLVDGWMMTKEAVEKYQQLKYQGEEK